MQLWFGRKRMIYVGIVRDRSIGNEVIAEFILFGSLDVQINKKGGFVLVFGYKFKTEAEK
jgi:hypothetical protein